MKRSNYLFLAYAGILIGFLSVLAVGCKKSDDDEIVYYKFNKDSVKDVDGNYYHTVTIGSQVWMLEDLKTTHYANGDPINFVDINDSVQWKNIATGAYSKNSNGTITGINTGQLYNWHTLADNRKLCPKGWHVPTAAEFDTLRSVVSKSKNRNLLNEVLKPNFTFERYKNGDYSFGFAQDYGTWWTSTESNAESAVGRALMNSQLIEYADPRDKRTGFCIRCIKD
jgi:uncharacterized protein (TIGR02145 family)